MTRYCPTCHRSTTHRTKTVMLGAGANLAERIFHGVCTLGFSECFVSKRYECQECGEIRR